jgi:hypothetical protein
VLVAVNDRWKRSLRDPFQSTNHLHIICTSKTAPGLVSGRRGIAMSAVILNLLGSDGIQGRRNVLDSIKFQVFFYFLLATRRREAIARTAGMRDCDCRTRTAALANCVFQLKK